MGLRLLSTYMIQNGRTKNVQNEPQRLVASKILTTLKAGFDLVCQVCRLAFCETTGCLSKDDGSATKKIIVWFYEKYIVLHVR